MSDQEAHSPTFDGNQSAEQSGQVADVSGLNRESEESTPSQGGSQPQRPDEAAQIIP